MGRDGSDQSNNNNGHHQMDGGTNLDGIVIAESNVHWQQQIRMMIELDCNTTQQRL
jgi:hypothetical protein